MNAIGIILILVGCAGLFLGNIMFGDIGVTATYSGIVAIITGIGFLKIAHDQRKGE